jgi:hypothetical protein
MQGQDDAEKNRYFTLSRHGRNVPHPPGGNFKKSGQKEPRR